MSNRRIPSEFTPNEITALLERKRRAGDRILDLTESNPTRVGLGGAGPAELSALADAGGAKYEPHPRGAPAAREAIARYYAERGTTGGLVISPDDLVLVASTSEAYAHLFRLLHEPGDEILVPRPSYPLFEPLAALEDVRVEHYRLAYHEGWRLDLDSVEAALSPRTRAIVIVQPNNPTGSCFSPGETAAVESLCAERGIAIISDEVFGDFPWTPSAAPLPTLLGERRALTFVLSGLSKLCGMPQLKLAWIALAGPAPAKCEALRGLEWIADLFLSVSTPVQLALPKLLEARRPFQATVRARLERNLARLRAAPRAGAAFQPLEGEGGWSAVLSMPARIGDVAMEALAKHDVLLHPGHFFDAPQENYAVASLLPDHAVFDEAVSRLQSMS
jgi:alanine-synthesizing transaminase